MHSHRSFFDSLIVVLLLALISDSVGAQITIREKINIVPQSHRSHTLGGGDSTLIITTPVAGTLHIGGAGAFNCLYSHYHILSPIDYILCGGTPLVVPGNWKAGTVVQAKLVTYPGYPYRDEFFPSAITHTYDPEYQLHDYRMDFPDFDIDNWSLHATVYPGTDFDHFRVQFDPDTIAYGDTAKIIVTAVDAGNQEVDLDGSTQLTFTLDSMRFGCFIPPAGGTVSSPLSSVTYSDARAGHVKFLANGARDTAALKSVSSRVEGANASGANSVFLAPITLSFEGADTLEVYPNYPGHNNSTTRRDTAELTLKTRFRGSTKPFVWVKVGRPALCDSGGHSHGGTQRYGKYRRKSAGAWITADSLEVQTDSSGTLVFKFLATKFGRVEQVKAIERASIGSGAENRATKLMRTSVRGLSLLPPGSHYVKTGGTCTHHGPQVNDLPPACRTPDTDHFGTTTLLSAIQAIADSFAAQHPGYSILVNDMSLPLGGKFEILGDYSETSAHQLHRLGENADLPTSFCQRDTLLEWDIRVWARKVTNIEPKDERTAPGGPHWHIYTK